MWTFEYIEMARLAQPLLTSRGGLRSAGACGGELLTSHPQRRSEAAGVPLYDSPPKKSSFGGNLTARTLPWEGGHLAIRSLPRETLRGKKSSDAPKIIRPLITNLLPRCCSCFRYLFRQCIQYGQPVLVLLVSCGTRLLPVPARQLYY